MSWTICAYDCAGLSWESLTEFVARLVKLRAKAPDRYLILRQSSPPRFVGFAEGRGLGSVRADAISNRLLQGRDKLAAGTTAALREAGWNRPTRKDRTYWRVYGRGTRPLDLAQS